MRIMEQARGDKVPPVLEPVAVGREAGSPRSSFDPRELTPAVPKSCVLVGHNHDRVIRCLCWHVSDRRCPQ
jgi:hypothetical protein